MKNLELFNKLAKLETEQVNERTKDIDKVSITECLRMISNEDMLVAPAVKAEIDNISRAVEIIVDSFRSGGRLFYFGAGTSGRLGVVDASECPPTFGTDPNMVQGVIAGGDQAMFRAQEGAEDNPQNGIDDVILKGVNSIDVVCGIAASGRTPYVLGALEKAKSIGCKTIFITTVSMETALSNGATADVMICPAVGAEAIAGSTRMKSGTAQKLVLNMLTTASMIQLGKTFGNIMIDLKPTNLKLVERSKRIVMNLTGVDYHEAQSILEQTNWQVKPALVSILGNVSIEEAVEYISKAKGKVRVALDMIGERTL